MSEKQTPIQAQIFDWIEGGDLAEFMQASATFSTQEIEDAVAGVRASRINFVRGALGGEVTARRSRVASELLELDALAGMVDRGQKTIDSKKGLSGQNLSEKSIADNKNYMSVPQTRLSLFGIERTDINVRAKRTPERVAYRNFLGFLSELVPTLPNPHAVGRLASQLMDLRNQEKLSHDYPVKSYRKRLDGWRLPEKYFTYDQEKDEVIFAGVTDPHIRPTELVKEIGIGVRSGEHLLALFSALADDKKRDAALEKFDYRNTAA